MLFSIMPPEFTFLVSGIILGLSSGLIPGPLLTLVISETLKHGIREGIKISIVPLLSDLPIVLVTILILTRLSDIRPALGIISILGTIFLFYLAIESLSFRGSDIDAEAKPQSFKKGIITNLLNPSPYIFWLSIGAPTVVKAMDIGLLSASLFIFPFYFSLVGSKIMVAFVTSRSRHFLKSRNFIYTIRALGLALLMFAALFLKHALGYFGLL
jgi:threonine/homoserine/homoserine lactone efflux protein